VIVDYAHTPDGLEKVLEAAKAVTKNRVILVFGATGDRDKQKRPIMGEIATRLADRIVLTDDENYTHAILMNCPFVDLNIPKENVIGLAFEPPQFLKVNDEFAQYAEKNVGRYFIGDSTGLPATFINKYAFMWHLTPPRREPVKDRLMSIMVSQKTEAPGHLYRHELVRAILSTDLDIHIYGRGCEFYQGDPRIKGCFENDDEPYEHYQFHICIENFQTEAYTSEKYTNTVLWGTTPIYLGSRNILFPENTIVLSGDVINDIILI
jgi:hypothetical protein